MIKEKKKRSRDAKYPEFLIEFHAGSKQSYETRGEGGGETRRQRSRPGARGKGGEHAAGVRAAKMRTQGGRSKKGPREKAGEAGMELETRGCGGRSGWQPVCVDASAVTVRADWRSQSVSQSVGSAPAATHDRRPFFLPLLASRVHISCISHTRAHAHTYQSERERTLARLRHATSPLCFSARSRARTPDLFCSAQFFRLDFSFLSREPASKAVRGPVCQCASSDYRPISAGISPKPESTRAESIR